jgi:soluble lytic murein transglycosylase-like protein
MIASSFLLAATLAAPSRAAVTADVTGRALPTLYALELIGTRGLSFGRYFDASRLRPVVSAPAPVAVKAPPRLFKSATRRLLKKPAKDRYDAVIRREAAAQGLDPRLVKSVIAAESEFTPKAKSRAGALGLMQLMPETAASVGVPRKRLFDPAAKIRAGTAYLAWLFKTAWRRYHLGDLPYTSGPRWVVRRVLAAYNAGPRWLAHSRFYRQTRLYVLKVMSFYGSGISELTPGGTKAGVAS